MFILGMLAMYFLLNVVVVVALAIKDRSCWKENSGMKIFGVIKRIVIYLFVGIIFALAQALE